MELAAGCQSTAQLSDLQRCLSWFRILWLPQNQAHQAMQDCFRVTLRNAIGVLDFLVARAAVSHGVPIQTFNVTHFRAVRGLRISVSYRR